MIHSFVASANIGSIDNSYKEYRAYVPVPSIVENDGIVYSLNKKLASESIVDFYEDTVTTSMVFTDSDPKVSHTHFFVNFVNNKYDFTEREVFYVTEGLYNYSITIPDEDMAFAVETVSYDSVRYTSDHRTSIDLFDDSSGTLQNTLIIDTFTKGPIFYTDYKVLNSAGYLVKSRILHNDEEQGVDTEAMIAKGIVVKVENGRLSIRSRNGVFSYTNGTSSFTGTKKLRLSINLSCNKSYHYYRSYLRGLIEKSFELVG